MIYLFRLEGKIKPYVRMTQRGKFVKKDAQEYLASKEAIAWQFRAQMAGYLRLEKTPLYVEIMLYMESGVHRCDLDNQVKAILDAMNGIVYGDDCWIDSVFVYRARAARAEAIVSVMTIEEYLEQREKLLR